MISSWGNIKKTNAKEIFIKSDISFIDKYDNYINCGSRLSYGDVCLSNNLILNHTSRDFILNFDKNEGLLTAQAGITFERILSIIIPFGFFLPVTPGTKFITLGGAIANDIHGKNHHQNGTLGEWIQEITILNSNGEQTTCSETKNPELFNATIGGLGLTGIILSATIKLIKISSPVIKAQSFKFSTIKEFFELNTQHFHQTYTVCWFDPFTFNLQKQKLKGIYFSGDFATHSSNKNIGLSSLSSSKIIKEHRISYPAFMPGFLTNNLGFKIFNQAYYSQKESEIKSINSFFYPLDKIRNWNKAYKEQGFYQFQCVLPKNQNENDMSQQLSEILQIITKAKQGSAINVMKTFGARKKVGMLSFPMEGLTISMDFKNYGTSTLNMMRKLYDLTHELGGRIYPAKDMILTSDQFQKSYPEFQKFIQFKDPKISSNFWERVST